LTQKVNTAFCTTSAATSDVPRRDFFSFCTTLRPIELKALGELSHVRHLRKNELIYTTGDLAEEIYSVNRGVVEVIQLIPGESDERSFVTRGDIFGVADALGKTPRSTSARAQETCSLQCFNRENFVAISQRVPSFLLFLCEQMALRLNHVRTGKSPAGPQKLSGSLANFDLITVHQTIISSGQTGELEVLNDHNERMATFFFQSGALRSGQFQQLTGEEAFWQLFLSDDIPGSFSFASGVQPITECLQSVEITQSPNEMLITAMRYRDEFHNIRKTAPDPNALLQRLAPAFEWPRDAEAELKPLAEKIWDYTDDRRFTINELFRQNAVCELKIYQVVSEMLRIGQIATVHPISQPQPQSQPQLAKAS
jgi:CRP-like cAMP-binding protein